MTAPDYITRSEARDLFKALADEQANANNEGLQTLASVIPQFAAMTERQVEAKLHDVLREVHRGVSDVPARPLQLVDPTSQFLDSRHEVKGDPRSDPDGLSHVDEFCRRVWRWVVASFVNMRDQALKALGHRCSALEVHGLAPSRDGEGSVGASPASDTLPPDAGGHYFGAGL